MSACRWFAGQPDQTSSQRDARSKERKGPSSSGDRACALPQNYRETASQGVLEVIPTTSAPRSLPPPMLYIKSYPPSLERVSDRQGGWQNRTLGAAFLRALSHIPGATCYPVFASDLSSNASVEYSFRVSRSASTPGSLRLGVIISGDFFSPPARVPRVTAYMWLSFHAIQNIALKFTMHLSLLLTNVQICNMFACVISNKPR